MIGIFYGSTTGNTEAAAQEVAAALGIGAGDVYNVADASAADVAKYDTLLLGSSTWGAGDMQDDWYDFIDDLKAQNLAGKKVAFFGTGDSDGYPDTFAGGLEQIYQALEGCGVTFVGQMDSDFYAVVDSPVCVDGKFLGLVFDDADDSRNAERLEAWVALLK